MADAQSLFAALAEDVRKALGEGEAFTLWYSAEASEFIRFNRAKVRQAGQVRQATARLQLIRDERHANIAVALSGDPRPIGSASPTACCSCARPSASCSRTPT